MSTFAAIGNTDYSMWNRIPSEDGLTSRLNQGFKLSGQRVPKEVAKAPALPMERIWQDAVEFDQNLREKLATEAANKKKTDEQALATSVSLLNDRTQTNKTLTPGADKTQTNLPATLNSRQTQTYSYYSADSSNHGDAYTNAFSSTPTGYSAQGKWAKPTFDTSAPLGMVVDLTA